MEKKRLISKRMCGEGKAALSEVSQKEGETISGRALILLQASGTLPDKIKSNSSLHICRTGNDAVQRYCPVKVNTIVKGASGAPKPSLQVMAHSQSL